MAFLACTTSSMIGTVPRMRFLLKRSNDIIKVREIPNAESLSCCFEDRAARTVCSPRRAAPIPATEASLPKNKRDIRLNNLGHGLFMDTLLRQSCQNNCTK